MNLYKLNVLLHNLSNRPSSLLCLLLKRIPVIFSCRNFQFSFNRSVLEEYRPVSSLYYKTTISLDMYVFFMHNYETSKKQL